MKMRYIIPILYIIADAAGIFVSFYLAYNIRFYSVATKIFPITKGIPDLNIYFKAIIFVSIVWLFVFILMGHYRKRSPSSFDRFWEVARGVSSGAVIIIATTFFYRGESFSRLVMGFAWILGIAIIYFFREVVYNFELAMLRRGLGIKKAIMVGNEKTGLELYEKLKSQPAWGIDPLGFIGCQDMKDIKDQSNLYPGILDEIENIVEKMRIDIIIFNLPPQQSSVIEDFVLNSDNLGLEYMLAPDTLAIITSNAKTIQIEGIPLIRWGRTPLEGYHRLVKRLFDMVISFLGLILSAPLLLILLPIIKIDSPGPVFFKQKRLGRDGRLFTIYKLRSMTYDPEDKPGWTVNNDPRLTKIGRFLRNYNIDELPQLFNVLMGQMSLVGPRPEQPAFVEKFKNGIPRYFQRHRVKSGMTGWAQVNGLRGDTSISERTKYDLYYAENWSLVFDLKIIMLTLKNMIRNPNPS